jgi:hypothetical protein
LNRTGSNTDGFIFDDFVLVARANGGGSGGSGGTALPFLFFDFDTPGTDWQHLHSVIPSYNDFLSSSGSGMPNVNQQQTQSIRQRVQRIFQIPTRMLIEDLEALDKMLNEMLKNCLGEALFDKFVGAGVKFNFEFVPGRGSYFDRTSNTVQIGQVVSDFTFFHELFHAYQSLKYPFPSQMWFDNQLNFEVEAHRMHYYFLTSQKGGMSDERRRQYMRDPMNRTIVRLERYTDANGNITNLARFNHQLTNVVVPVFKAAPQHKNYADAFNPDLSLGTMFASMHEILAAGKNCLDTQNRNK